MLIMEQGSWKGLKNRKSERSKKNLLFEEERNFPWWDIAHQVPPPSSVLLSAWNWPFVGHFHFLSGRGDYSTKARVLSGTGVGAIMIWKQRISSAGPRPQGTCSGTKLPSAGMFCPALQRPTPNTKYLSFWKNGDILLTRTVFTWLSQAWARGKLFHLIFSLFSRQGCSLCGSGCYGTWSVDQTGLHLTESC